jgi:hypothetical protein
MAHAGDDDWMMPVDALLILPSDLGRAFPRVRR